MQDERIEPGQDAAAAAQLPRHPAGHRGGAGVGLGAVDPYAGAAYAAYAPPVDAGFAAPPPPDPREQSFRRAMQCGIRSCPAQEPHAAPAA